MADKNFTLNLTNPNCYNCGMNYIMNADGISLFNP